MSLYWSASSTYILHVNVSTSRNNRDNYYRPLVMGEVILQFPQYPRKDSLRRYPVLPITRRLGRVCPPLMFAHPLVALCEVLVLHVPPRPVAQPRFGVLDIRRAPTATAVAHRARLRVMLWRGEEEPLEPLAADLREGRVVRLRVRAALLSVTRRRAPRALSGTGGGRGGPWRIWGRVRGGCVGRRYWSAAAVCVARLGRETDGVLKLLHEAGVRCPVGRLRLEYHRWLSGEGDASRLCGCWFLRPGTRRFWRPG